MALDIFDVLNFNGHSFRQSTFPGRQKNGSEIFHRDCHCQSNGRQKDFKLKMRTIDCETKSAPQSSTAPITH